MSSPHEHVVAPRPPSIVRGVTELLQLAVSRTLTRGRPARRAS